MKPKKTDEHPSFWQQHILVEGEASLHVRSEPIEQIDARVHAWVEKLSRTLESYRQETGFGRAIAAPQVGINHRLVVMNLGEGPMALINPEITWRSQEMQWVWDDCLSVPDKMFYLQRHLSISVTFTHLDGTQEAWRELPADTSELIQHEIDHLDGVLMVQRAIEQKAPVRPLEDRALVFAAGRRQQTT